MKALIFSFSLLMIMDAAFSQSPNTWTQKADFGGTGRVGAVGFSIGSKGYIGTGFDSDLRNDFWEYDPATNAWTQKTNFGGTAREFAVGFSIGGKGYIGTGYDGVYKNDFWEYDPSGNAWTQKANFGGTTRYRAVGFSIGGAGYIGTGFNGSYKNDFWEYSPASNAWTQKANFGGTARYGATGFSINSKGYLGTGHDGAYKNDFWEYDPSNNTWIQRANFGGTARYHSVGFSINAKGYIGFGSDGFRKSDFWEFDPVVNTWAQKASFEGAERYQAAGFSISNKGYIGTGSNPFYMGSSDFWEYTADVCTGLIVYADADGDNYGDPNNSYFAADCFVPAGYIYDGSDCNDDPTLGGASIYPGQCDGTNGVDDNCNGTIDDGSGAMLYYTDADGDGYGAGMKIFLCNIPGAGYSTNNTDCNDNAVTGAAIHPGAIEIVNSIDDDCNGLIDDIICSIPTGLQSINISATSEKLKWHPAVGAISYKLRYKVASSGSWTVIGPQGKSKIIEGLSPNTTYVWQIRSKCSVNPNITSDWSPEQHFTTFLRLAEEVNDEIPFSIYPNPAQVRTIIQFTLIESSSVSIKVFDLSGNEMVLLMDDELEAGEHSIELSTDHFAKGVYVVRMISDGGMINQKLVVQ